MIEQIQTLTDQQIDSAVTDIIAGAGNTARDFELMSQTYNSQFFAGLPSEFKVRACRALRDHFVEFQNNYWNKSAQEI